ncbi:MAG: right-handed parallel beta-helix repeat-containing protein [Candidatus Dormibacteraeota bacterium]|nr:right-handed parallel beta-helix repeat-containing protein [Candidatus Dormibacteraeota bacterium]
MQRAIALLVAAGAVLLLAGSAGARVLRVGSYHGVRGQYQTIQAAVKAAHPGDWILIGPGDYKTKPSAVSSPRGFAKFPSGVLITKARLHLRGMNRNTVIVDGTRPGSAICSRAAKAQNFGRAVKGAKASGLNGLMVWKAAKVSIENLTACNFLGGSQDAGNQVWWNGGADSGTVGGYGFRGSYLTATSTYFKTEATAAKYGVFSSNWSGGTWDQMYASNFNDSGFYIGACQQVCNQTVNHIHSQYSVLGYSGTNSGGRLLIENSEFDHNKDGFDTNSQNADEPAPQNGACPAGVKPPVAGAPTCWVFTRNYVHDNNNPNVPAAGAAAAGPVGTGISLSGARNDTVIGNRFVNNQAWGIILVPYIDHGGPCSGGTLNELGPGSCLFDQWGNAVLNNQFASNGGYGHPSNGDIATLNFESGHPTNCYAANSEIGGGSIRPASAAALQTTQPSCNGSPAPASSSDPAFLNEVLCDTQVSLGSGPPTCPTGPYPRATRVVMHRVPKQKTMKNPCQGVPGNPWCSRKKKA